MHVFGDALQKNERESQVLAKIAAIFAQIH
jgi:hypothetical protein